MSVCSNIKGYTRRHEWLADFFSLMAAVLFFGTLYLGVAQHSLILSWISRDLLIYAPLAVGAVLLDVFLIFFFLNIGSARLLKRTKAVSRPSRAAVPVMAQSARCLPVGCATWSMSVKNTADRPAGPVKKAASQIRQKITNTMKLVIFANGTRGNQKANNITMMMTSKVATTGGLRPAVHPGEQTWHPALSRHAIEDIDTCAEDITQPIEYQPGQGDAAFQACHYSSFFISSTHATIYSSPSHRYTADVFFQPV